MTSDKSEQLNRGSCVVLLKGFVNWVWLRQDCEGIVWLMMSSLISVSQRGTLKVSCIYNCQNILHTPRAVTSEFIWDSDVRKQNLGSSCSESPIRNIIRNTLCVDLDLNVQTDVWRPHSVVTDVVAQWISSETFPNEHTVCFSWSVHLGLLHFWLMVKEVSSMEWTNVFYPTEREYWSAKCIVSINRASLVHQPVPILSIEFI